MLDLAFLADALPVPTGSPWEFLAYCIVGMAVAFAGGLAWFGKSILIPMRDRHFLFLDKIELHTSLTDNTSSAAAAAATAAANGVTAAATAAAAAAEGVKAAAAAAAAAAEGVRAAVVAATEMSSEIRRHSDMLAEIKEMVRPKKILRPDSPVKPGRQRNTP